MEKIYEFDKSIVIGEEGEEIVKKYLESLPAIHKVVNMAKNPLFYHKDVDFVIEFIDATKKRLEIKTDTYTSGNIYYETVSNNNYKVDGCMKKTECDWLAYYFIKFDKLYLLKMDKYKEVVEDLIKKDYPAIKKHEVKNRDKTGTKIYTSIGYTIPLYLIEELLPANSLRIYSDIKKELEKV